MPNTVSTPWASSSWTSTSPQVAMANPHQAPTWMRPGGSGVVERERRDLREGVARPGVVAFRAPAEVAHHAPDGIERGLHRALGPAGGPRDVVAGEEHAALLRREVVLHEMAE